MDTRWGGFRRGPVRPATSTASRVAPVEHFLRGPLRVTRRSSHVQSSPHKGIIFLRSASSPMAWSFREGEGTQPSASSSCERIWAQPFDPVPLPRAYLVASALRGPAAALTIPLLPSR